MEQKKEAGVTLADISKRARERQITRSLEQSERSRRLLSPAIVAELFASAQLCRSETDREFRERAADVTTSAAPLAPVAGEAFREHYPLGHCGEIRDAVWNRLAASPVVKRLQQEGLVWKKVFFIQEGRYFQNAIQCGDYVLDAANDTVSMEEPAVVFTPLDHLVYENIDGWSRYAEVAESYYQIRVYPNCYFPLVFPLAPFLAIRSSGRVDLLLHQDMIFLLDLGEGMCRSRALLGDKQWMERVLPPSCEAALESLCGANQFETFPLEFRRSSVADLHRALEDWSQLSALPHPALSATIKQLWDVGRSATRRLRRADIRATEDGFSSHFP